MSNLIYLVTPETKKPTEAQVFEEASKRMLWDFEKKRNLDQYLKDEQITDYEILSDDQYTDYCLKYYDSLVTEFKEIDEETFYEMFECLPPHNVVGYEGGFLFTMSEFDVVYITGTYAKYKDRYFSAKKCAYATTETFLQIVKTEIIDKYFKVNK